MRQAMNDAHTQPVVAEPATPRRSLIPWYVGLLVVATALVAGLSSYERIAHTPLTFGLLVALTLALDTVRIDIFERGNISPATVPAIALAYLFGPAGPICGEAAAFLWRLPHAKTPLIRRVFDFGLLSLAGVSAAVVFALLPAHRDGVVVAVAVAAGLAYY